MRNLVKWNITKETGFTFLAGICMILLSVAMLPFHGDKAFDTLMSALLRDVLMIFGLGVCVVTLYCNKRGNMTWHNLGLKKEKILVSLLINTVLAIALLFMFLSEGRPENLVSLGNFYAATYILVGFSKCYLFMAFYGPDLKGLLV